jgi:hypothetical protein
VLRTSAGSSEPRCLAAHTAPERTSSPGRWYVQDRRASGTCDQFSVWWLAGDRTPRWGYAGPHARSRKSFVPSVVKQPRTAGWSDVTPIAGPVVMSSRWG